jgi:hypothetical protein
MDQGHYLASLRASRAAAQEQLHALQRSGRFLRNGEDLTDHHRRILNGIIDDYDRLLGAIAS